MKKLKNIKLLSICVAILIIVSIVVVTIFIKLKTDNETVETADFNNEDVTEELKPLDENKIDETDTTEESNNQETTEQVQEGVTNDNVTQANNPSTSTSQGQAPTTTRIATTPTQNKSQQVSSSQVPSQQASQPTSQVVVQQQTTKQTSQQASSNQERFVRNDEIINRIKSIINSNVSDTMRKYGYNVVVDSSIKNQTTGFTFTEQRVKNAIANSFGTIRIYAENYYVGNELRWTNAYIL